MTPTWTWTAKAIALRDQLSRLPREQAMAVERRLIFQLAALPPSGTVRVGDTSSEQRDWLLDLANQLDRAYSSVVNNWDEGSLALANNLDRAYQKAANALDAGTLAVANELDRAYQAVSDSVRSVAQAGAVPGLIMAVVGIGAIVFFSTRKGATA